MNEYALALSKAEVFRYRGMAELALEDEQELWGAAGVVAGARVADVGCGPGAITVALGRLVGDGGQVWGIDQDPGALAVARGLAAREGLENVRFQEGSATGTGLAAGSVDVVMMRHVLAHNGRREQAIVDHLAALVRPGGCVYLVDIDGDAVRAEPDIPELVALERAYRELHARRGNDLAVGRRLPSLLAAAGLESVESYDRSRLVETPPGVRPPGWAARQTLVAEGLATEREVARWGEAFDRLDSEGPRLTVFAAQRCAFGRRRGT